MLEGSSDNCPRVRHIVDSTPNEDGAMATRPNIIFIFSDQQHYQAVGCVDPYFRTPNWDRFASQAVRFEQTYCTTPLCSPSRATLMTGLMPRSHGVVNNGIHLRSQTIGKRLQESGYYTAYFGKWHLGDDPVATEGWDEKQGVYNEYVAPNRPLSDRETGDFALDFLNRVSDQDKPFALFVSFDEPHGVYWIQPTTGYPKDHCTMPPVQQDTTLPQSWYEAIEGLPIPCDAYFGGKHHATWGAGIDEAESRQYRELYRDRAGAFDRSLGELLEVVERRGFMESSVVVVTSDHGDMDTHHRLVFKGPAPFEQLQRVPLAVHVPDSLGGHTGVDADSLVSNVDLYPTLLEFAKADPGAHEGISLRPVLTGGTDTHPRTEALIEYPSPLIQTIRRGNHKYSLFEDGGEMLYDVSRDPEELRNLAAHSDRAALRDELHAHLQADEPVVAPAAPH